MNIQHNVSLANYSTMRLGGVATYLTTVEDQKTLIEVVDAAKKHNIKMIMIGKGSNIIWRDEGFPGLVIVNKILGFELSREDEIGVFITVGSGESWDSVVKRSVDMGLSGIECLSLIPGTAGATPVQNVGAYGQDISQTLVTIYAYDSLENKMVTLSASDCELGYRKSRFNTKDKGRFFITSITLCLRKMNPLPPFYPTLASYLEEQQIKEYTPEIIRNAVIKIRQQKLPDPEIIPNCGSFFANPIVDKSILESLQENFPMVPSWSIDNSSSVKLSAAWLLEQIGLNNYFDQETGIATYEFQPLIFVNRSAKNTNDLIKFADLAKNKVKQQFNIDLIQEPLLLP